MNVIISAGGTGGHIFPAVAVADELKKQDPSVKILFVGALGKMEMERVPKAGYAIEGLPIAGFQRRLSLKNVWLNLQLPFKIINSLLKVRRILKDFKPDVVVGFGGFASGPTLKAAASFGIPTILQEQNSYAGVTNKLLAEKAMKICVAYDGLDPTAAVPGLAGRDRTHHRHAAAVPMGFQDGLGAAVQAAHPPLGQGAPRDRRLHPRGRGQAAGRPRRHRSAPEPSALTAIVVEAIANTCRYAVR